MKKTKLITAIFLPLLVSIVLASASGAQPYGKGTYDVNVPYGAETSLSISTDGDVSIPITPTSSGVLATGNSEITVTSTDVKGYKLYIRALNSIDMDNLGAKLPASANVTPAALAVNTWGYNTDASTDFVGITTGDVLIHAISVPASSGDITNVTYGIKLDMAKPAGNYTANVVYTAVPQTD